MKTIGLIGGMSWESTNSYYALINQGVHNALQKNHSARCLVYSFDFQEIEELQYAGEWDTLRGRLADAGKRLKLAGADFLVVCTNTMHKVVDGLDDEIGIPFLHIAEAVGAAVVERGFTRIGLLGTIFTMEQPFYKDILQNRFGLSVLIPDKEDRVTVNSIIYDELVKGIVKEDSRKRYETIMDKLAVRGAQGIVLACTEIGMLVNADQHVLFDSTILHAREAVKAALSEEKESLSS
jgi:aspartate racemase